MLQPFMLPCQRQTLVIFGAPFDDCGVFVRVARPYVRRVPKVAGAEAGPDGCAEPWTPDSNMTTKTVRRAVAASLLVLVAGSMAWLAVQAGRSGPLPDSAPLPPLSYRDGAGAHVVRPEPHRRTAIVLFNSQCGHCLYELDAFNRRLAEVDGAHIYFLTTEANLPSEAVTRRWPALMQSRAVSWGTVHPDEFRGGLRTLVTPAVFVFDERGRLLKQFRGETKFDLLVPALSGAAAG
jgi:hypothetical protein